VAINANRTLTYQPNPGFVGQDTFTYEASDGISTAVGVVTVDVKPNLLFSDGFETGNFTAGGWVVLGTVVVDPSAAFAGSYGALLKKTSAITKVLPGIGPGNVTLSYARRAASLEVGESGSLQISSDGQNWSSPLEIVVGTSDWQTKQFEISLPSSDLHLRFSVNGNAGNDLFMVDEVTVTGGTAAPVNNAPVANPQSVAVVEDGSLLITLTGTDADGDSLTYSVASSPANGTLSGTAPNLTYTPDANFHGPDTFSFTVNDGTETSAPELISIGVSPVNDAPVAGSDAYSTLQDTELAVAAPGVLANDTDPEGDALTVSLEAGPASGTLALNANGSFTYTPTAGFTGVDSFSYTVSDGNGGADSAVVNVTVQPQPSDTMHVGSVLVLSRDAGKGLKRGYAEVIVVDAGGNPVPGALVTGSFSEDILETSSSTTGADGKAVFLSTATVSGRCRLTFTVNEVFRSDLTYDPAANVETSDKNH
jgi:hypothetical protein